MELAEPLRIGMLGAARIAPFGVIRPAREAAEAEIVAVAACDEGALASSQPGTASRARTATTRRCFATPGIDAIYDPLPNGLHRDWTIRALEAGKHVLCEKPLASNAAEAGRTAAAAERSGRKLKEAFDGRNHPLADRMKAIVDGGSLRVRRCRGRRFGRRAGFARGFAARSAEVGPAAQDPPARNGGAREQCGECDRGDEALDRAGGRWVEGRLFGVR
jgi:predicted dehydrogenase